MPSHLPEIERPTYNSLLSSSLRFLSTNSPSSSLIHHQAGMFALTWVLNSTAVARIQLFLLNEFVNHSGISKLEHMSNKTGYPDTPPTLLLFEMVQIKLLALHYRSEKKNSSDCAVFPDINCWTHFSAFVQTLNITKVRKFALVQYRDTFSQRTLQKSKESNNRKKNQT